MNHTHYKKSLKYLLIIIVIFFAVFLYAYISFRTGRPILSTRLGFRMEAAVVMLLSAIGIIRAIVSLHRL